MRTPSAMLALTLALAAFPAAAQQASKANLSHQDRNFAEHAMAGGMAEVEMGKLAESNAGNEAVKSFGQRMVSDHSHVNQQFSEAASGLGLSAPKDLPRDERRNIDKLSKLHGAEFDRAYMSTMIDEHKKDLGEFRKQADKGENATLKQLAQQTVPTLEQHLQLAEDTQSRLHAQQSQVPR